MGMRLWKKFICLCFAIGFPVFLTGCPIVAQKKESQGKVYYTFFDTVSTIYSYAGDDEGTFEENAAAAEDLLEAYHRRLDIYHEYSGMNNLCTVNKGAGGEAVEVDLVALWVMEETLVEEVAMVVEVVAAEVVMEVVMVDIMDLEVMVATMVVVLVTVVEEVMEVVDQDMETRVVDMVVEEEAMMVTMKEEILVEVTMVVVETIMTLEIIVDSNNQIMDP